MPDLMVRNIPEAEYESLKQSAKAHGRSLNSEILAILSDEDAWIRRRLEIAAALPELDKARAALAKKYPHATESVELIREDRDAR